MDPSLVQYVHALSNLDAIKHADVAGACLAVIEWISTLADEIDLVWASNWTSVKILYLASRYAPILDVSLILLFNFTSQRLSSQGCSTFFECSIITAMIGVTISECILVRRTLALYENSKVMKGVILGIFLSYIAGIAGTTAWVVRNTTWFDQCRPTPESRADAAGILWIIIACFEFCMVILTIWQGKDFLTGRRSHIGKVSKVVYHDSLLFFTMIVAASIVNAARLMTGLNSGICPLFEVPVRVIHSSLSCRILLNLRGAASSGSLHVMDDHSYDSRARNRWTSDATKLEFTQTQATQLSTVVASV